MFATADLPPGRSLPMLLLGTLSMQTPMAILKMQVQVVVLIQMKKHCCSFETKNLFAKFPQITRRLNSLSEKQIEKGYTRNVR